MHWSGLRGWGHDLAGDRRGGYIGAHVVRAFGAEGIDVVVIDDLSNGHREFVRDDVPFVEANLLDAAAVWETITRYGDRGRTWPVQVCG